MGHQRGIAAGIAAFAAALTISVSTAWATFPGANGRVAYGAYPDGIHTVLPSGRGDTTISSTGSEPAWSPNGKWLAFTGYAPEATGTDIFAMRADGSDERRLTYYGNNNFGYGWTNTPSYSPGGGRIVFLSTAYHEHTSITTMRNDGSNWQYPLPYSDRGGDPVWSPGGEIAYSEGGKPRNSIWAMNPDGSNQHRLVYLGKAGGYGPIYSPDGSGFLFLRYRADHSISVRLANSDGTDVRPPPCESAFTTTLGYGTKGLFPIAYSPDGRWLLESRYEGSTRKVDLLRLSLASCSRKVVVRGVTGEADWQSLPSG